LKITKINYFGHTFSTFWEMNDQKLVAFMKTWYNKYGKLLRFLNRFDRYPIVCTSYRETSLAKWVNTVQILYAENRLPRDRIDQINDLPNWEWRTVTDWDLKYGEYREFVHDRGFHPEFSEEDNEEDRLYKWALQNRRDHKQGNMVRKHRIMLEKIPGWKWRAHPNWDEQFEKLEKYLRKYGRYPLSVGNTTNYELRLAIWMGIQRTTLIRYSLPPYKRAKLESLQNWEWDRDLDLLSPYINSDRILRRSNDNSLNQGNLMIADNRSDEEVSQEISNWYKKVLEKYEDDEVNKIETTLLRPWIVEIDFAQTWESDISMYRNFISGGGLFLEHNRFVNWINRFEVVLNNGNLDEDRVRYYLENI
jgi:hypothetical protein